jgi:hypothetical protein
MLPCMRRLELELGAYYSFCHIDIYDSRTGGDMWADLGSLELRILRVDPQILTLST